MSSNTPYETHPAMKTNLLRAMLVLFSLGACQRDQGPVPYQPYPGTYVKANLNGVDWQSQYERYGWVMDAYAYESPGPNLGCASAFHWVSLRQVTRWGSERSAFSIQLYQFSPKRYSLQKFKALGGYESCIPFALFTTLEGNDAPTGDFNLKPDADNFLTIEKFDPEQRFIEGTFQMTFVPENVGKYSFLTATDTLRFTEGRFRARLRRNTDPDWGK